MHFDNSPKPYHKWHSISKSNSSAQKTNGCSEVQRKWLRWWHITQDRIVQNCTSFKHAHCLLKESSS